MNYSKLSNLEINKMVAHSLGYTEQGVGWINGADGIYDYMCNPKEDYRYALPDYCNSWTHAGPIIEKEKIHLFCEDEIWDCRGYNASHIPLDFANRNPLRAAMIVFLMMQEKNNDK